MERHFKEMLYDGVEEGGTGRKILDQMDKQRQSHSVSHPD